MRPVRTACVGVRWERLRSFWRYWQVLPLNPVTARSYYSPYQCASAFAGNTLLISPERLFQDGWLQRADLKDKPAFSKAQVDFRSVAEFKQRLLGRAYACFQRQGPGADYERFVEEHSFWLEDYIRFVALKQDGPAPWNQWDNALRDRRTKALNYLRSSFC